jgi:hypothetical protein
MISVKVDTDSLIEACIRRLQTTSRKGDKSRLNDILAVAQVAADNHFIYCSVGEKDFLFLFEEEE